MVSRWQVFILSFEVCSHNPFPLLTLLGIFACVCLRPRRYVFPVILSRKKDLLFQGKIQLNCTVSENPEFSALYLYSFPFTPQPLSTASLSLFS